MLPPKPATAAIATAFVNTAGYEMQLAFPAQIPKLMVTLGAEEVWGKMDDKPGPRHASRVRLQQLLIDFDKNKRFAEPEGHTLAANAENSSGVVVINPGEANAE